MRALYTNNEAFMRFFALCNKSRSPIAYTNTKYKYCTNYKLKQ